MFESLAKTKMPDGERGLKARSQMRFPYKTTVSTEPDFKACSILTGKSIKEIKKYWSAAQAEAKAKFKRGEDALAFRPYVWSIFSKMAGMRRSS